MAEEFGVHGTIEKMTLSGRTDRAIVTDMLRLCGLEESDANRERLHQAYLRHAGLPEMPAGPGAAGRGRSARTVSLPRGHALLGLLTGKHPCAVRLKLGHFGLADAFAFGGYGDRHLHRDDVAREAFAEACRHLGQPADPARIRVIGDTPHDVDRARAISAGRWPWPPVGTRATSRRSVRGTCCSTT